MHLPGERDVCMYASNTRERSPKLDFNTKILLTSRIMHRFQRFLMFWKAECLLFHLETTFPHCFVFVRSKTWHLWKVCLIYWTNAGSSIPVLVIYLSLGRKRDFPTRWIFFTARYIPKLQSYQFVAPNSTGTTKTLRGATYIWGGAIVVSNLSRKLRPRFWAF